MTSSVPVALVITLCALVCLSTPVRAAGASSATSSFDVNVVSHTRSKRSRRSTRGSTRGSSRGAYGGSYDGFSRGSYGCDTRCYANRSSCPSYCALQRCGSGGYVRMVVSDTDSITLTNITSRSGKYKRKKNKKRGRHSNNRRSKKSRGGRNYKRRNVRGRARNGRGRRGRTTGGGSVSSQGGGGGYRCVTRSFAPNSFCYGRCVLGTARLLSRCGRFLCRLVRCTRPGYYACLPSVDTDQVPLPDVDPVVEPAPVTVPVPAPACSNVCQITRTIAAAGCPGSSCQVLPCSRPGSAVGYVCAPIGTLPNVCNPVCYSDAVRAEIVNICLSQGCGTTTCEGREGFRCAAFGTFTVPPVTVAVTTAPPTTTTTTAATTTTISTIAVIPGPVTVPVMTTTTIPATVATTVAPSDTMTTAQGDVVTTAPSNVATTAPVDTITTVPADTMTTAAADTTTTTSTSTTTTTTSTTSATSTTTSTTSTTTSTTSTTTSTTSTTTSTTSTTTSTTSTTTSTTTTSTTTTTVPACPNCFVVDPSDATNCIPDVNQPFDCNTCQGNPDPCDATGTNFKCCPPTSNCKRSILPDRLGVDESAVPITLVCAANCGNCDSIKNSDNTATACVLFSPVLSFVNAQAGTVGQLKLCPDISV